ncbi:hypothetical protein E2C01_023189 [Portunus trituberculatus]|uniref:Uncharacterized protein n=1 Tax=Portunus trituberculatus TaxID=210409 RepID=A0A5B7E9C1_PORTR|nr:hypothetical protein [Portunus trituberculatus]
MMPFTITGITRTNKSGFGVQTRRSRAVNTARSGYQFSEPGRAPGVSNWTDGRWKQQCKRAHVPRFASHPPHP